MTSAQSWPRRVRATLADAAMIFGLRRIDNIPAAEKRAVEPVHDEIRAASKLLAAWSGNDTRLLDNPSRGEPAIHELIGLLDRIAESDATAANDLRRRLTALLFASDVEDSEMGFWLLRGNGVADLVNEGAQTPKKICDQIVSALRSGASKIRTSSVLTAYLAALADIPTELEIRAPVEAGAIPALRDLARLPSAKIVAAASIDLADRVPGGDAGLFNKRGAMFDDHSASLHEVVKMAADPNFAPTVDETTAAGMEAEERAGSGARILWLYGSESQSGWAYGINAQRLASRLSRFRHTIGEESRSRWIKYDIKFSFDVLILRRKRLRRVRARRNVLRVGGAAPLLQVAGDSRDILARHLSLADAIIVLSPELQRGLSDLHPRVFFIPNGIDLREWNPTALSAPPRVRPFRAGIAASLRKDTERDIKGYDLAVEACRLADVPLLAVGRGVRHVPHDRMIKDFYSEIDVLIHPTAPGKEACSNVVMEALALGIPVITTRYAGMHGQLLEPWREALVVPRSTTSFAAALFELKRDGGLRRDLAAGGRDFAERFHDLDAIGRQYARVFDIILQSN